MKNSIRFRGNEYETEREGASILAEIKRREEKYQHGSSGIEKGFQKLPEGFRGYFRGEYVEKGYKGKVKKYGRKK